MCIATRGILWKKSEVARNCVTGLSLWSLVFLVVDKCRTATDLTVQLSYWNGPSFFLLGNMTKKDSWWGFPASYYVRLPVSFCQYDLKSHSRTCSSCIDLNILTFEYCNQTIFRNEIHCFTSYYSKSLGIVDLILVLGVLHRVLKSCSSCLFFWLTWHLKIDSFKICEVVRSIVILTHQICRCLSPCLT